MKEGALQCAEVGKVAVLELLAPSGVGDDAADPLTRRRVQYQGRMGELTDLGPR